MPTACTVRLPLRPLACCLLFVLAGCGAPAADQPAETTSERVGTGDAWVTSWDSEHDADEFERAIADHVANATAGSATDASFRVVRVDLTTVVLFVGPRSFVGDASATPTDGGGVRVRPPNATVGTPGAGASS